MIDDNEFGCPTFKSEITVNYFTSSTIIGFTIKRTDSYKYIKTPLTFLGLFLSLLKKLRPDNSRVTSTS